MVPLYIIIQQQPQQSISYDDNNDDNDADDDDDDDDDGDDVCMYVCMMLPRRRVRINAKIVVCSAGALHTPAVLLRSGIAHISRGGMNKGHSLVGAFLTLHPVLGAAGMFPKDVVCHFL